MRNDCYPPEFGITSEKGLRPENQDFGGFDPERGFAIVADGMGGAALAGRIETFDVKRGSDQISEHEGYGIGDVMFYGERHVWAVVG